MKKEDQPQRVIATVQRVFREEGYVFTTSPGVEGSITFSLTGEVWAESELPTEGAQVILEDIREQSRGLRAFKARFHRFIPKRKEQ